MTPEIFLKHKSVNKHLTFELTESKLIPIEKTWSEEYGIYNIFRRDFYTKSNLKKCYVDTFVKEVSVDRNKLTPCKDGFSFRIKPKYLNEILIPHR